MILAIGYHVRNKKEIKVGYFEKLYTFWAPNINAVRYKITPALCELE